MMCFDPDPVPRDPERVTGRISIPALRDPHTLLTHEAVLALVEAVEAAREYKRRMHLILSTIYSTHGFLVDGEIDTAAKFRAIERLARLDWNIDGTPREDEHDALARFDFGEDK